MRSARCRCAPHCKYAAPPVPPALFRPLAPRQPCSDQPQPRCCGRGSLRCRPRSRRHAAAPQARLEERSRRPAAASARCARGGRACSGRACRCGGRCGVFFAPLQLASSRLTRPLHPSTTAELSGGAEALRSGGARAAAGEAQRGAALCQRRLHCSPLCSTACKHYPAYLHGSPSAPPRATRSQVVAPEAPEWEADYKAWAEQRRLARGYYKQYPATVRSILCGTRAPENAYAVGWLRLCCSWRPLPQAQFG